MDPRDKISAPPRGAGVTGSLGTEESDTRTRPGRAWPHQHLLQPRPEEPPAVDAPDCCIVVAARAQAR